MKTRTLLGFPAGFVVTLAGLAADIPVSLAAATQIDQAHTALTRGLCALGMLSSGLWLIAMLAWVVLGDSRRRWPHAPARQRARAVLTLSSPPQS